MQSEYSCFFMMFIRQQFMYHGDLKQLGVLSFTAGLGTQTAGHELCDLIT